MRSDTKPRKLRVDASALLVRGGIVIAINNTKKHPK